MGIIQTLLQLFSAEILFRQVYQHQVVVRISGYDLDSPCLQVFAQCLRILYDLFHIGLVFRLQRLLEADCLGRDHMHQRTSLCSREHGLIKVELFIHLLAAQDHASPWPPKGLVGRGGGHMSIGDRAWMQSCGNQAGDMGNIHHQVSAHFIRDLAEPFEVNGSGICAGPRHDQLRTALLRDL